MPKRRTDQETIEQALTRLENMVFYQHGGDQGNNRETSIVPLYSACLARQNDSRSASLAAPGRRILAQLDGTDLTFEDQG
jgi:ABC-type transport system involved in cytochrome c biogenesis ATPase subunit